MKKWKNLNTKRLNYSLLQNPILLKNTENNYQLF